MQQWEYMIVEVAADSTSKMQKALNDAGALGFEAVASWGIKKGIGRDTAAVVLKRPVPSAMPGSASIAPMV